MHDIIGHYNRFDVFSLHLNATPQQPLVVTGRPAEPAPVHPEQD
jgi:aliphatic nitrilase